MLQYQSAAETSSSALPGVVPDGRALAADDRDPALAERAHVRHRIPERALGHVGDANAVLTRVPWWLDEAPPDPEAPPLAGDAEADVAIVGGGYTGLWTALELKRRDPALRVVVLEAEHVGYGPSGRNGGFLETYWCALPRAALAARRRGGAASSPAASEGASRRGRARSARTSGCARGGMLEVVDDGGAGRGRRRTRSAPRPSSASPRRRALAGRVAGDLAGLPARRLVPGRGHRPAGAARPRAAPRRARRRRRAARAHARHRRSAPARSCARQAGVVRAPEIVVATNAWMSGWRPVRGRADAVRQLRRPHRARSRAARRDRLDGRRGDRRRPDVPPLLPDDRTTAAC